MNEPHPVISVVICTYNRARYTRWALESLAEQNAPPETFEVVLVDNNSIDETPRLPEEFRDRLPRLRYERETKQGLSNARNCGMRAARGDYVIYLDDDAKAPPHWIARALQIIADPAADVFGGPYYPYYDHPRPEWFKDAYASKTHGDRARPLGPGEYVSGGNMAFRRDLLLGSRGFDPDLGMTGDKIAFAEEYALLDELRRQHPDLRVWYDPEFYIRHLVKQRLTEPGGMTSHFFTIGRYRARTGPPPGLPRWVVRNRLTLACLIAVAAIRSAVLLAGSLGWSALFRDRTRFPSLWNVLHEHGSRRLQNLGSLYERALILLDRRRFLDWRDRQSVG